MKKHIFSSCFTSILALFLAMASVQAQSAVRYQAEIPFDFVIGNETYEAGDYSVSLKDSTDLATVLSVRNGENRLLQINAVSKTGRTSGNGHTKLVFERYGGNYVLKRIEAPDFGFNAPKSKIGKRLAKKWKGMNEIVAVNL